MTEQRVVLSQTQRLRLSPQLYQSIKLMTLPLADLRLRIQQELEENPALEVVADQSTVSLDSITEDDYPTEQYQSELYQYSDGDAKRQFIEGALARSETLHEHLLWQLRVQPVSPAAAAVGELLIANLDDHGFHREEPLKQFKQEQQGLALEMIRRIQQFDPPGACTADAREALIVQTSLDELAPPLTINVLHDHFQQLQHRRYHEIAAALSVSEQAIKTALDYIRTLEPFPGRRYAAVTTRYVIPDLQVAVRSGEPQIIFNNEVIPALGVNKFFEAMIESATREASRFAQQNIRNAQWFIGTIHRRNATLLKTARAIVHFQREFFFHGSKALRPLTLNTIAGEIGMHEATVSRITTAKYMQTEWGIFSLKYFFSTSVPKAGTEGLSREAVKEMIRELMQAEVSGARRISDQRISDILAERGVRIARRTVAKYRAELQIDTSYNR